MRPDEFLPTAPGDVIRSVLGHWTFLPTSLPPELRFTQKAGEPLATLVPSEKLAHLITESRKLAAAGAELEGE